jgi:hypothetical protein
MYERRKEVENRKTKEKEFFTDYYNPFYYGTDLSI